MLIKGVAMSMSRLFVLPSDVKECEWRNEECWQAKSRAE